MKNISHNMLPLTSPMDPAKDLLKNGTTDGHTLTLKVDPIVTHEQVKETLTRLLADLEKRDKRFKCVFISSMVKTDGKRKGRYYVWLSNTAVYNVLIGKNPDGTSRIKRYPDPNWKKPEYKIDYTPGKSWADLAEEEEAFEQPMIEEQLPPLVTFPDIPLDLTQQNDHETHATSVSVKCEAALAHNVRAKGDLSYYTLKSSELLPFQTEKSIKADFQCFSSSKRKATVKDPNRRGKAQNVEVDYPVVTIVEQDSRDRRKKIRVAFVTFDSMTNDASFAFFLMRQREYTNSKTGEVFTVNYTYARSSHK